MAGSSGRTGRRPGRSGTREAIAAAARKLFAELGYDRATIRAIAQEAGVDPALVSHYFGPKQKLFASVTELPFEPEEVLPGLLAGPRSLAGERLARFVVTTLADPANREASTSLLRAAASEPLAAELVRTLVSERMIAAYAAEITTDRPHLRAGLIVSQVIGLAMARNVIEVEPLAAATDEELVAALAPTLQRYLTGTLDHP